MTAPTTTRDERLVAIARASKRVAELWGDPEASEEFRKAVHEFRRLLEERAP